MSARARVVAIDADADSSYARVLVEGPGVSLAYDYRLKTTGGVWLSAVTSWHSTERVPYRDVEAAARREAAAAMDARWASNCANYPWLARRGREPASKRGAR